MAFSYKDRFYPVFPGPGAGSAGNLSENALWLLGQRYFANRYDPSIGTVRKESSFGEFARRVARIVAAAETISMDGAAGDVDWLRRLEGNIFNDIMNRRFLFNSPCLFAAGAGMTVDPSLGPKIYCPPEEMTFDDYALLQRSKTKSQQLFACFVIDVPDSIDGIFDGVKDAAVISKYGGGVGGNFGRLRERGSAISGGIGGQASGPVSFMETWNTMGAVVVQGGRRRAALMGMLFDDHPDIYDFIDAKVEEGRLPYFNISVCVSDKLMEVSEGGEFSLVSRSDGRVVKRVNGADLWNKLCESAWKRGDPGIFFIDRANDDNLLKMDETWKIESTNPCVTGDTWALTDEGPRQVRELVGKPGRLMINGEGYETAGFFSTGVKPVFELKTREGRSLKLTGDHRVRRISKMTRYTEEFEWVEARSLRPGDMLALHDHGNFLGWQGSFTKEEGYLAGLLMGDGVLKDDKAVLSVWAGAAASGGETVMAKVLSCAMGLPRRSDFAGWSKVAGRDEYRLALASIRDLAMSLGMAPGEKGITPVLEGTTSSAFYRGFLKGLFDSDGSVQGTTAKGVSVRLARSNLDTLGAVQRMLARLGIQSTIYENRREASERPMPDGKGALALYPCKDQHELVISKGNMARFAALVGFEDSLKKKALNDALDSYKRKFDRERFFDRFQSLTPLGEEEVFDASVPGVNAFDANGFYVHNCGEQPLPNYTSCNLGSINAEAFVRSSPDGKKTFDYEGFGDQVFRSMYYLDLVIDACSYPLERIGERTRRIRPVGLGLMGLADTAIMLGMKYGSPRFNEFCKSLGDSMGTAALCATAGIVSEMGKEPFPEANLVEGLFSRFAGEQGHKLFPEAWYGSLDREGFRSLLEKMRSSSTIPYTLANALEGFATARGLGSESDRLKLAGEVLLAFARGRIRNSRRLSIAPTGSISMLIDTSAGIEPNFAWSWNRRIAKADGEGQETREFCHKLLSPGQVDELHDKGKLSDPIFATAHDISPEEHVEVTGIFSRVVDSGISKTVNLPSHASVDDVKEIYRRCYSLGAKGITIYRDGSRSFQPIETTKKAPEQVPHTSRVKERPGLVVFGKTIKETTPWGSIYVTLNFDGTEPFEVFATIGKSGSELKAMTEALSRAISIGLRSGGKLEDFIATLKGLSGKEYWLFEFDDKHVARSIPDAIAMLLEKLIGREGQDAGGSGVGCPECGSPMEMISGCEYCFSCGYSPCK